MKITYDKITLFFYPICAACTQQEYDDTGVNTNHEIQSTTIGDLITVGPPVCQWCGSELSIEFTCEVDLSRQI